jgi:hypothetical protein
MARRTRRKNARIHNGNIPATAPAVRTTASSCTGAGGGERSGAEERRIRRFIDQTDENVTKGAEKRRRAFSRTGEIIKRETG